MIHAISPPTMVKMAGGLAPCCLARVACWELRDQFPRWWTLYLTVCLLLTHMTATLDGQYSHARRVNVLKVTSVEVEPYLMRTGLNSSRGIAGVGGDGSPRFKGYIFDLVDELSKVVGFRYELETTSDNSFGYRQQDGSWDGMIGDILDRNADVAAGPLLVTNHRKQVVDFTAPFMRMQATLLVKREDKENSLHGIVSINDIINQSDMLYGTLEKGVIIRAFKKTNDTQLMAMWKAMSRFKPSTLTTTNEEGIHRVRHENYAYVLPDTIAEYIALKECDLATVGKFLLQRDFALALAKGSPWIPHLNKGLGMLKKRGFLDTIYRKWWVQGSQCVGSHYESNKMYRVDRSGGAARPLAGPARILMGAALVLPLATRDWLQGALDPCCL